MKMSEKNSNKGTVAALMEYLNSGLTKEEVLHFYDNKAHSYDQLTVGISRNSVRYAAEELARWLPPSDSVRVLDIGAGTGQVGAELASLGYHNIDALDPSQKMLDIARSKNLYQNTIVDYVGSHRLDITNDNYDAAVTSGTFINSHLHCDCFDEIIRITKPGGYFVFVMEEQFLRTVEEYKDRLVPRLQQLHDSGHWKWVSRKILPDYMLGEDAFICAFQIL